ncbi:metallophosphoesterase family protein [Vibrio parahaemolyticus]|uniref:metallophosphoesterase family protein n=1 Tax=Vibrio parahaemolyticus TaxID=670 RepID=UPI001E5AC625|nr:metallophosphoesterase [Vibrio parahaemolyticus]
MDIIHLSDLHFGDECVLFNESELSAALCNYIYSHTEEPIIILSGDITSRGKSNGYSHAVTFIERLLTLEGVKRENLCFCPGNHDIVEGSFEEFNTFVYGARRDHTLNFKAASYNVLEIKNTVFLILNSSFHLNHKFGLIDDDVFNLDLAQYGDKRKVLICHHHILNQFNGDTSAIRNAYDLVQFIEKQGFCLVLHGHQHTDQHYHVGKNATPVVSARSGNLNQSGYLNAFNHYKLTGDGVCFESLIFERSSREVCVRRLTR